MKRSAMSLTELLVGIAILTILAGITHLSPDLYKQTSKREAEKICAILSNYIQKANATQVAFNFEVNTKQIKFVWQNTSLSPSERTKTFDASSGCSYSWKSSGSSLTLTYSPVHNNFNYAADSIIVKGKGPQHYIIIEPGGRMRLSDTPP